MEQQDQAELQAYWQETLQKKCFYHGTTTLFLPQIEKHGLQPTIKHPCWSDFEYLHTIYTKANVSNPLCLINFERDTKINKIVNKDIFLTSSYHEAKTYATKSQAIWHGFAATENQYENRKKFIVEPFFQNQFPQGTREICEAMYTAHPHSFYEEIVKYFTAKGYDKNNICSLSKQEVYEIKKIVEQLWITFKQQTPIILHVSILAPSIAQNIFLDQKTGKSAVYDFNAFLNMFNLITQNKGKNIQEKTAIFEHHLFNQGENHILIKEQIPLKFIRIEHV